MHLESVPGCKLEVLAFIYAESFRNYNHMIIRKQLSSNNFNEIHTSQLPPNMK